MKVKIKPLILSLLIIIVAVLIAFQYYANQNLYKDQKETVELFGYPHQFVITYLPSGEDNSDTLTRIEVWYYDLQQIKITFMGGRVFNVEEFDSTELENVKPTKLKPEDFYLTMLEEEIIANLNDTTHAPLDILNDVISDANMTTYISTEAIFTIEEEYLTYFQTIGVGNETE